MDVEANIREFLYGSDTPNGPLGRYASFDYCFNYFQSFRETGSTDALAYPKNLEVSCLQLGFYLASWGMLRGSSALLQRSMAIYEPVVRAVAGMKEEVWEIDADRYTEAKIGLLLKSAEDIRGAFGSRIGASDTLVTKVMLGVFGNVPAYDSFVRRGLWSLSLVAAFGRQSLRQLGDLYFANKAVAERYRVPTLEFGTGKQTGRQYTRAKVLDMVLFTEGTRLGGQVEAKDAV